MAIDYEKLRKAAQELQARMTRGGGPSMKFWKPADGKNVIRILPPWTEEGPLAGQFYREVHQHWNVSEEATGPVLCPKKTPAASEDKACPICDLVDQLKARKNDVDAQELVKNLRAKAAYLMSVIDLSDPTYTAKDVVEWKKERPDSDCPFEVGDPKVQCYAATNTIADAIMNIVIANEMDITDLEAGHNIVLTKIPNKDKLKTRYSVTPDLKKTKAAVPADFELPDLGKIGKVPTHEDMVKLLSSGPAGSYLTALPSNAGSRVTGSVGSNDGDTSWIGGSGEEDDLAAEMKRSLA